MRWVLGLTVILGIGLAAAWLLGPGQVTPMPPGAGNGSDQASETTGFADADAVQGSLANDEATGENNNPTRTEFTNGDNTPAALPGPSVLVVQGEPATPVNNAQVFFVDEAKYRLRANNGSQPIARFEAPELFGMRVRTDQDGRARLPGGSGRWLCGVQRDQWFGFKAISKKPQEHTITLVQDEHVVIAVHSPTTDAGPQSVQDIPLAVVQLYKNNYPSKLLHI